MAGRGLEPVVGHAWLTIGVGLAAGPGSGLAVWLGLGLAVWLGLGLAVALRLATVEVRPRRAMVAVWLRPGAVAAGCATVAAGLGLAIGSGLRPGTIAVEARLAMVRAVLGLNITVGLGSGLVPVMLEAAAVVVVAAELGLGIARGLELAPVAVGSVAVSGARVGCVPEATTVVVGRRAGLAMVGVELVSAAAVVGGATG